MSGWPVPLLTLVQDEDGTVRAPVQSEVEAVAIMTVGSADDIYHQPTHWAGLTFTPLPTSPYGWKVTWDEKKQ